MPKLKTSGTIHDTLTGWDFTVDEALRPRIAMRKKCLECAGASNEVKVCPIKDCTLWPYRMGRGLTSDIKGEIVNVSTVVGRNLSGLRPGRAKG